MMGLCDGNVELGDLVCLMNEQKLEILKYS